MINELESVVLIFYDGDEEDFTASANLPFSVENILDETLNSGRIILSGVMQRDHIHDITHAFEPNTIVEISLKNQSSFRMIIDTDVCRKMRKDTFPTYKHSISLIEETKKLERDIADSLCFTNPLERSYNSEATADWIYEV